MFNFGEKIFLFISVSLLFLSAKPSRAQLGIITHNCNFYKFLLNYDYEKIKNTPLKPDASRIYLNLYEGNQTERFSLKNDSSTLLASPLFKKHHKIVIFLYGYLADLNSPIVRNMVQGFLEKGELNVLTLNTLDYIRYNYFTAITNVRFIGEDLGFFLSELIQGGFPASKIHLVGHSLGAHMAGFAGKTLLKATGTKLGRISGLEVAGPCFYSEANDYRLYKTDADFVDVIHTDAGNFGIKDSVGHIDFWPNGGLKQPYQIGFMGSHNMSWLYYLSSIRNPTGFVAIHCPNMWDFYTCKCKNNHKAVMGYAATINNNYDNEGNYYLSTTVSYPYYLGEQGVLPIGALETILG